jgi:hypothetical protein
MDNNKKTSADMHAFMRELIQEVLEEDRMVSEYIDFDLKMFATQADIGEELFKADLAGKLEAVYNKLKEKVSGGSREEAIDYFYSFIKQNRDSLDEEGKGLWHNIRAKQARGEKPARKGSKAHKDAVKAAEKINATNEESIMEGATCCGRCGRVHKLKKDGGEGCKKPYLSKSSPEHCMNK